MCAWPEHAHDAADREPGREGVALTEEELAGVLSGHRLVGSSIWTAECECGQQDGVDYYTHLAARLAAQPVPTSAPVIDAEHIEHQRAWSAATFGPSGLRGPTGPLAHIRKEVEEVAEDPFVLEEWVDVLILAFDGAWRAGHEPQQIIDAIKAKQAKNEARSWPDWREYDADEAIEHVRDAQPTEGGASE